MSILDRLNLLIRSELSELTRGDRSKAMADVDRSLRDAKRQQIELRKGERALIQGIRAGREKAERWEERAILALKSGDEDLAREALIVKNRTLDEVERMRDELDEHRAQIKDIERALEAIEMKLEGTRGKLGAERDRSASSTRPPQTERDWDAEMRRRLDERDGGRPGRPRADEKANEQARRQAAEELGDAADEPGAFQTGEIFGEFDRMSGKIDAMEAEIDAMRELSGDDWADPRRRELEDIFSRMERSKKAEKPGKPGKPGKPADGGDDLADLKKKFE